MNIDEYIVGIERDGNHIALSCECVFNYNQNPNLKAFSEYYFELWCEIHKDGYSKKYHPVEYKYVIDNISNWCSTIQKHCKEHIKTNKQNERSRSCVIF